MASLSRNLRKGLENVVKEGRRVAEAGARQAIEQLATGHHEPWSTLTPDQRRLRNRLRAHGRQLGDRLDERKGTQTIEHLISECAYEHWHRMLFARFLAENHLLVEPESGIALSLQECQELARERGIDWLVLASEFAQRMLPEIFRPDNPVLDVNFPPEKRQELEALLEGVPQAVFVASDSLGWVYQFWQAEQKEAANKSGKKIGAAELPAVTQLFTEDYMVQFLLHNTLGAWWAGKVLARDTSLTLSAASENELRTRCALPGVDWEYLRFAKNDQGRWAPAAGDFPRWPRSAGAITICDPAMGSGHFLVFALPILVAFRVSEEKLSLEDAVSAVLSENLFGVELDLRCTQIGAFNLALTAWRMLGMHKAIPLMHVACAGLRINARRSEWTVLAGGDPRLEAGMQRLFNLFAQAPVLGSLIDPRVVVGDLIEAGFDDLRPLLAKALAQESDEREHELAVTAKGISEAAGILSRRFTLVATNVPYLSGRKQDGELVEYVREKYPDATSDLSAAFFERVFSLLEDDGVAAVVAQQSWLFTPSYEELRKRRLTERTWAVVTRLGPGAFETISGQIVNVGLFVALRARPSASHEFLLLDAAKQRLVAAKREHLRAGEVHFISQASQERNAGSRIGSAGQDDERLLSDFVDAPQGIKTGDDGRWIRQFWELASLGDRWEPFQSTVPRAQPYGGRGLVVDWSTRGVGMTRPRIDCVALGRSGVAVSQTGNLPATLYSGSRFDSNVAPLVPREQSFLPALWAYCSSPDYCEAVRAIDQSLKVSNVPLTQVPFDLQYWTGVATDAFPDGLPKPESDDATQWLFSGRPERSTQVLQVAALRLLGYRWPSQTDAGLVGCDQLPADVLDRHADPDGMVCLSALRGEATGADRLRALLADAFGPTWSAEKQRSLLGAVGSSPTVEEWLRNEFFEQHCEVFRQRPFVWHIWDGLKDGFNVLINYHRLFAGDGEGPRVFEKLIYTYLGDWIDRQREERRREAEGADARIAAAEHLKRELEKIGDGEPPFDVFVRWKPLCAQSVGWEPDASNGVRLNIRPFMKARTLTVRGRDACILRIAPKVDWDKDRGKEVVRNKADYPWFWGWDGRTSDFIGDAEFDGSRWNDLHYSRSVKLAARDRIKGIKP